MSRGFCLLAQNNGTTDYIRQAHALALSLHMFNKDQKISLITNDIVPEEWQEAFDQIIPIPWSDNAADSDWKIRIGGKNYQRENYSLLVM